MSLCTVFDVDSSNIDEVLSINQSANLFDFDNFNTHHLKTGWSILVELTFHIVIVVTWMLMSVKKPLKIKIEIKKLGSSELDNLEVSFHGMFHQFEL